MSQHSKACCTLPPSVAEDYTHKGTFKTFDGVKTYTTGPADAKKAIYLGYDIFGLSAGTLQGADILASAGYLVTVPDLLLGRTAQAAWFAPELSEEEQAAKADFFAFMGKFSEHISRLLSVLDALKTEYTSVESWGYIGYCWGAKLAALTSGAETQWKVSVQTSPARVDPEDAAKITIPHALLVSKDENVETVKAFATELQHDHFVEYFSDQVHGWMGGRAILNEESPKKAYDRGYQLAADFFMKHL